MKNIPQRKKHWAKECFEALQTAIDMLKKDFPELKEEEKIEIFKYAPGIATLNRAVKDDKKIAEACDYTAAKLTEHIEKISTQNMGLHYPVVFTLCYLNSQISFGCITQKEANQILSLTISNYDLDSVL